MLRGVFLVGSRHSPGVHCPVQIQMVRLKVSQCTPTTISHRLCVPIHELAIPTTSTTLQTQERLKVIIWDGLGLLYILRKRRRLSFLYIILIAEYILSTFAVIFCFIISLFLLVDRSFTSTSTSSNISHLVVSSLHIHGAIKKSVRRGSVSRHRPSTRVDIPP